MSPAIARMERVAFPLVVGATYPWFIKTRSARHNADWLIDWRIGRRLAAAAASELDSQTRQTTVSARIKQGRDHASAIGADPKGDRS